jgi:hypothetical protein
MMRDAPVGIAAATSPANLTGFFRRSATDGAERLRFDANAAATSRSEAAARSEAEADDGSSSASTLLRTSSSSWYTGVRPPPADADATARDRRRANVVVVVVVVVVVADANLDLAAARAGAADVAGAPRRGVTVGSALGVAIAREAAIRHRRARLCRRSTVVVAPPLALKKKLAHQASD